jgi:DNA-binding response OmpR family regulator
MTNALLELLNSQLVQEGYEVIKAANGKQGLRKAVEENPDIILLDIKMPVMDGLEMINLLRKKEAGKKIKVIMLTNVDPDSEITGKVINGQPLYYFIKSDIKIKELLEKIKELLRK